MGKWQIGTHVYVCVCFVSKSSSAARWEQEQEGWKTHGIVVFERDIAGRWNYLSPPNGHKVNSKSLMLTVKNCACVRAPARPSAHRLHLFHQPLLKYRVCACVYLFLYNIHIKMCVRVRSVFLTLFFQLNGVDLNCTVVTIFKQISSYWNVHKHDFHNFLFAIQ